MLLGDLPALAPQELDDALAAAAAHPRTFVPDAERTGTSLVTAQAGADVIESFGADSAFRHHDLGLVELTLPADSGLRRDVDTPGHLREAAAAGVGPFTRAALASAAQLSG